MAVDTHQGYKRLVEAGMPESQAEAQVALFSEWVQDRLVTREYLDQRLGETEARIDQVEARIDVNLAQLREEMIRREQRLTQRIMGALGVATAILAALIAALNLIT